MAWNTAKVHHCQQQELVALRKAEPPARRCRCRRVVDLQEANDLVEEGVALEVVVKRERGVEEAVCDMCNGDKKVINCAKCNSTGKIERAYVKDTKNFDIVLLRHRSKNVSTPKVPTIESEHIEYAYVNNDPKAQARIEEYGLLTLEARAYPGPAKCKHRKDLKCTRCLIGMPEGKEYVIGMEPADNPKTGEGRTFDYGRSL